ncbi:MAG: bifunctional glutamate N-acetyltransferase/amino-acid acetyltransferase ArgJ [Phycisphaeraceae bacterium]|nr:bifunctional glutamate N-acetyltransferase/amino-acid acetyltransferase ArgJ [Phycisphaeraceae bacterium]
MPAGSLRSITFPKGFRASAGMCGIKPSGKSDLALIVADGDCSAAGVFTRNRFPGAPVELSRRHVRGGTARAIVCNSGIANVATGEQGRRDALVMCDAVAQLVGCARRDVLVFSTGVIGQPLPMILIDRGITEQCAKLGRGPAADANAARAIMTTDLVPKAARRTVKFGARTVRIAGIAKGSGMIAPNMATMLAFVTTDANIRSGMLRAALKHACDHSFNRISVDHDTSTSDAVIVMASGLAGNRPITAPGRAFDAFCDALTDLCRDLAYKIVADGEGATKIFRVAVKGARSVRDADRVGRTVAGSQLVKTAVHGGDPNWGRLVAAVGRSGAAVRPDRLTIHIDDICVLDGGQPMPLSRALQRKLNRVMTRREMTFTIDLRSGRAHSEWLGCDLSREYVAINANYTT